MTSEHAEKEKGNWFHKMVEKQKERHEKGLRAEKMAEMRREERIQGGGGDGMLNREF